MEPLRVISLYTGAGGLDYGFEAAGFETTAAVELDGVCAKTLNASRSWPIISADINDVATRDILGTAGLKRGEADVLIGGPPCQPFSKSGFWATGSTKRLEDPRASTLENYLRVLEEAQPRAFLMENVEGLGFRGKDEGLTYIHARLDEINTRRRTRYRAHTAVLNAADFGVPQLRRRMFIVGARDGREFRFPSPTHAAADQAEHTGQRRHLTAWDALRKVRVSAGDDLRLRGKWADLLPTIPEGQNYLWHTERGGGEPLFGWRRRYWSFLLKLAKNAPSWTIQAQPGPATGPFHWANRRLSVEEMARLQTFPSDVKLIGTYADAHRQLGNAVPSLLAEVLARSIAEQLLDVTPRGRLKLAVAATSAPIPPAETPAPMPRKYLALRGVHAAHPGTGKGYRAMERAPSGGAVISEELL
ncbi:DNA (cytosine-5-)-methyltransferase [Rhodoplanes elegans]|uniref:Cytosine-specific methyltransferase n=1 Tax=Rhodoplanes elegans TaxID=29408 RepID=A0A327KVN5_9BRAD|nr:DNA (cytosine-5-)-methyltransferase [Rhodoplanes elegans]MBK5957646.1 DNA (cytosine-5-)-methyltransferase [Rhodoplanes elegans]RAI41262.1 DNA (cytosine-5-)-methyltransferase [Rhodoplanes elegans]